MGGKHIYKYHQDNGNAAIIFAADFNCHFDGPGSSAHTVFHETVNGGTSTLSTDKTAPTVVNDATPDTGKDSMFRSAYKEILGHEPEYTTCKWRQGGSQVDKITPTSNKEAGTETEDYIFYLKNSFKARSIMSIPEKTVLIKRSNGNLLPDWGQPSDHFYILSDLDYILTPLSYEAREGEATGRSITELVRNDQTKYLKKMSVVISGSEEKQTWGQKANEKTVLEIGDEGRVLETDLTRSDGKCVKVRWHKDRDGEPITRGLDGNAFEGWTNAKVTLIKPHQKRRRSSVNKEYFGDAASKIRGEIMKAKAAEKEEKRTRSLRQAISKKEKARLAARKAARKGTKTRRMAQREFSDRRDSPVMVRLLQQIVDAQDANK